MKRRGNGHRLIEAMMAKEDLRMATEEAIESGDLVYLADGPREYRWVPLLDLSEEHIINTDDSMEFSLGGAEYLMPKDTGPGQMFGIDRSQKQLLSTVTREVVEHEMRATMDHWERAFATTQYRMEGDDLARFNRFADTFALVPHDNTGDERHGDWECGGVERREESRRPEVLRAVDRDAFEIRFPGRWLRSPAVPATYHEPEQTCPRCDRIMLPNDGPTFCAVCFERAARHPKPCPCEVCAADLSVSAKPKS